MAEAKAKASVIAAKASEELADLKEDAAEAVEEVSKKAKGFWAKLFGK